MNDPHPTHSEDRARRRRLRRLRACLLVVLVAVGFWGTTLAVGVFRHNLAAPTEPVRFGATFSIPYAQELGIPWHEAYLAVLDDLGVKKLRLPAYWTNIEPEPGAWNWEDLDWQVAEAEERGVEIILAVGRKLPRWPECHVPGWAASLTEEEQRDLVLDMVRRVVGRYSSSDAVVAWQVENEPFFPFGVCPPPDRGFLEREIAVVRSLDLRPVVITESGELSTWLSAASLADVLGVSTYRVVWNKFLGYVYWPLGPDIYRRKWVAVSPFLQGAFISELQAEPWSNGAITAMSVDEQKRVMSPARLRENVEFARRIGFPDVLLWGVEWWYWARGYGYGEIWDTGRELIRAANATGSE